MEVLRYASTDDIKWLRQRALGKFVYEDVTIADVDIAAAESLYDLVSHVGYSPIHLLRVLKEEMQLPYDVFKKIEDILIS
jgi:hypothetical protein